MTENGMKLIYGIRWPFQDMCWLAAQISHLSIDDILGQIKRN